MGDKALPYDVLKKVMRTCTDADCWPFTFATHRIGADTPPNWTVTPIIWVCGAIKAEVTPCNPGASPVP